MNNRAEFSNQPGSVGSGDTCRIPDDYLVKASATYSCDCRVAQGIYDICREMMQRKVKEGDLRVQASLLLLATWNSLRFGKPEDLDAFKQRVNDLEPQFKVLDRLDFEHVNFEEHREAIAAIFDSLSSIKGVEFTGAAKLMHLRNPKLFVPWDRFISGQHDKRHYNNLDIYKKGYFVYNRYSLNSDGYLKFLVDMQKRFVPVPKVDGRESTKVIDEFNYVNISLPVQAAERQEAQQKKREEKGLATK